MFTDSSESLSGYVCCMVMMGGKVFAQLSLMFCCTSIYLVPKDRPVLRVQIRQVRGQLQLSGDNYNYLQVPGAFLSANTRRSCSVFCGCEL